MAIRHTVHVVLRVAQHSLRSEQNGRYGNDEGDGQKGGCRGARGGCGLLLPRYVLRAPLLIRWNIGQCDQIVTHYAPGGCPTASTWRS
jgi:hypothetical protein